MAAAANAKLLMNYVQKFCAATDWRSLTNIEPMAYMHNKFISETFDRPVRMSNLPPFRLWRYWRAYSTLYCLHFLALHNAFVFKYKNNNMKVALVNFLLRRPKYNKKASCRCLGSLFNSTQSSRTYASRSHVNTATRSVSQFQASNFHFQFQRGRW